MKRYARFLRNAPLSCLILAGAFSTIILTAQSPAAESAPVTPVPPANPGRPSDTTYRVQYVPGASIQLDGKASEPAWARAHVEKNFRFPWLKVATPATEFRAICNETHLFFHYRIQDDDIVVLDKLRDKQDAVFEDRAEFYLSRDDAMKDYYCGEVDSRGRVYDYHGSFYRQIDPQWNAQGLEAAASPLPHGYEVEIKIPLATLEAAGFPWLKPGVKIRCGLYRAEFSHDRGGRPVAQKATIHNRGRTSEGPPPIENWISWIDPKTPEPDFHVPASLGWLEIVR